MRGAIAIFLVIALAQFLRLFLSIDITDESNYVCHVHAFLLDGRLFHSDLFIHGTAAVIIAPLVAIYKSVFGLEGLVLFLRFLYYFWSLATAVAAYHFFKRYYSKDLALIAAAITLAHTPFTMASWSYNTVSLLGVPLSLFLLFSGSTFWALIAGIVAAMACFAYATISLMFGTLILWMWLSSDLPREITKRGRLVFTAMIAVGGAVSFYFIWQGRENWPEVIAMTREFDWVGGLSKLNGMFDAWQRGGWRTGFSFILLFAFYLIYKGRRTWMTERDPWILVAAAVCSLFSTLQPQWTLSFLTYFPFTLLLFYSMGRLESQHPPEHARVLKLVVKFGLLSAAVFGYTSSNVLINMGLGLIMPMQILLMEASASFKETHRTQYPRFLLVFVTFLMLVGGWIFVYRDDYLWRTTNMVKEGPYRFLHTTPDRAAMLTEVNRDLQEVAAGRTSIFSNYLTPAYLSTDLHPVTGMLFLYEHQWRQSAVDLILFRTLKRNEWPDVVITKIISNPEFKYQFEDVFKNSGKYELAISKPWYRIMVKKP